MEARPKAVRLLLDSHVLLWWAEGGAELRSSIRAAISDADQVAVSLVTPWELGIKAAAHRLFLPSIDWSQLERRRVQLLPILLDDALRAAELPRHHRDPFDRMIIAQAARLGLTIVSRDRAFRQYSVPLLHA